MASENLAIKNLLYIQRGFSPHFTLVTLGFTSGVLGKGKFAEETTAKGLKEMIEQASQKGIFRPNTGGRAGSISEFDFGRVIGQNSSGVPSTRLRVVINPNGSVKTAFPY